MGGVLNPIWLVGLLGLMNAVAIWWVRRELLARIEQESQRRRIADTALRSGASKELQTFAEIAEQGRTALFTAMEKLKPVDAAKKPAAKPTPRVWSQVRDAAEREANEPAKVSA